MVTEKEKLRVVNIIFTHI